MPTSALTESHRDGGAGLVRLTGVRDGVTLAQGTGSFTVGRAKHNGQLVNWFAGAIDKVEFREGVLTDAQIAALAQP